MYHNEMDFQHIIELYYIPMYHSYKLLHIFLYNFEHNDFFLQ